MINSRVESILSYWLLAMLFVCMSVNAAAADDKAKARRNSYLDTSRVYVVYLETVGNSASILSVNFEVPIWQVHSDLSVQARVSAGISTVDFSPGSIPLLVKVLMFGNTDWLELGTGVNIQYRYAYGEPFYQFSQSKVNPTAIVGYRYQSVSGLFVFRVSYAPIYDIGNKHFVNSFGLSVGLAF